MAEDRLLPPEVVVKENVLGSVAGDDKAADANVGAGLHEHPGGEVEGLRRCPHAHCPHHHGAVNLAKIGETPGRGEGVEKGKRNGLYA